MNPESVEQLIALFKFVAHSTQENQLKIAALEHAINQQQEFNGQNTVWGGYLRFVPSARAERQKIEEEIESLREALLRDWEDSETDGGHRTCACARPSDRVGRK